MFIVQQKISPVYTVYLTVKISKTLVLAERERLSIIDPSQIFVMLHLQVGIVSF